MKTRTLSLLTFAVCGVGIALANSPVLRRAEGVARVGDPAPGFALPGTDGKLYGLPDYKGKYVVLEWTNHDCPFVVKHYSKGDMQATQKWATDKGVVWFSIVSSAPGKQGYVDAASGQAVMKAKGHKSTAMLLDPVGNVGKVYGAKTTPHMFVIDPKGKIIYAGGIDDKRTPNQADIATSKNYVKAALEEAWAGKPVSNPVSQPYGCSVKYAD